MIGFSATSPMTGFPFRRRVGRAYVMVLLALALVVAALLWSRGAGHPLTPTPLLLLPVALGAALDGWGGGLFAMALGWAVDALWLQRSGEPRPFWDSGPAGAAAAAFLAAGLLLCLAGEWWRRAGRKAREAQDQQWLLEQELDHHRKREEALLHGQRRLQGELAETQELQAVAPIALASVDSGLRLTRANPCWADFTGPPVAAQLGRSLDEAAPGLGKILAPLVLEALETRRPVIDREIAPHPAAAWLASVHPARDAADGALAAHLALRDITHQKGCETALRECEQRCRDLAEAAPQAVWIVAADHRPEFANRRWLELTGLDPAAAGFTDWLTLAHPDDREPMAERIRVAREGATRCLAELRLRSRFSGEFRWHGFTALPLRNGLGAVGRWLLTVTDIHAAKSAEEAVRDLEARLELALEMGPMASFLTMGTERPTAWLDPADLRGSLGCEAVVEDWIGSPDALPPADSAEIRRQDFAIAGADGTPYQLEASMRALAGRPYRRVGVVADRTPRRAAEDAQRRSHERLREVDRQRDEFLAVLTHELRNPLTPILTSAQLLRRRGLERPDLLESATATIERQVKLLSQIIADLADVSRIGRGKITLNPEILELDALMAQIAEQCRPLLDQLRQELYVDIPEHSVYVLADSARLAQAVTNLLNNASRFTPTGRNIHLTVATDSRQAVIRVRDEGIGIDPAALERIFEPLIQLQRPLHGGHMGLGTGLTLARRLVELQGGTLGASSEGQGKGSEFVIRLPLADAAVPVLSEEC